MRGNNCPHSLWKREDAGLPAEQIKPQRAALAYIIFGKGLMDKVGVSSFPPLIILKHPSSGRVTSYFHKGSLWGFFVSFLIGFD